MCLGKSCNWKKNNDRKLYKVKNSQKFCEIYFHEKEFSRYF